MAGGTAFDATGVVERAKERIVTSRSHPTNCVCLFRERAAPRFISAFHRRAPDETAPPPDEYCAERRRRDSGSLVPVSPSDCEPGRPRLGVNSGHCCICSRSTLCSSCRAAIAAHPLQHCAALRRVLCVQNCLKTSGVSRSHLSFMLDVNTVNECLLLGRSCSTLCRANARLPSLLRRPFCVFSVLNSSATS